MPLIATLAPPLSSTPRFAAADIAPPEARDDAFTAREVQIVGGNLLADNGFGLDLDPLGEGLQVVEVMGQASYVGLGIDLAAGRVRILEDGTFWFDTAGDFGYLVGGEDAQISVDYTIEDGEGRLSTATLTMTILGDDNAPRLHPDFLYFNEKNLGHGNVFDFNGVGVDYDPEGADLRVLDFMGGTAQAGELVHLADGGMVRMMADGQIWFRADGAYDYLRPGEMETVSFTYRATDGIYTSTSSVILTIEGRNTAPVARPDAFEIEEGTTLISGWLFNDNGSGADSDIDSSSFEVSQVNQNSANVGQTFDLPQGGILRVLDTGQFWFKPLHDFDYLGEGETETVTFTYTIFDGDDGYSRATVSIDVIGVGYDSVVAQDDNFSITQNGDRGWGFTSNDYDNPQDEPEVISVSFAPGGPGDYAGPKGGILTLMPDGQTVNFNTNNDFDYLAKGSIESFDFTYEIEDRNGDTSEATVTINVQGRNDAPTALDDHFEWSLSGGNDPMNVFADNGFGADYDIDVGDTLSIYGLQTGYYTQTWDDGPLHIPGGGTASIDAAGNVTLEPHSEDIQGPGGTTIYGGDLEAGDVVDLTYRIQDPYGLYSTAEITIDILA